MYISFNNALHCDMNYDISFMLFPNSFVMHTQIPHNCFPLIDLNPQTYVDNIFKASEEDFKTQTHTVFTDSSIEFSVLKN